MTPTFGASTPPWIPVILAAAFSLKHYIADFAWQTNSIARGKEGSRGWGKPLLAHCACHALLTAGIATLFAPRLWWLALVDLTVHAVIDRTKAQIGNWGRWTPAQPQFWRLFGLDQLLHHLSDLGLVLAFLTL